MSAVNTADLQLAAGPHARIVPVPVFSNITMPFDQINGASKPANNATVGADWGVNILATRPNMLLNGGFELGITGWTVSMPSGGNLFAISDSVWGRILSAGTVPDGIGVIQAAPFPVQAGETYTISGDSLLFGNASSNCYFDMVFVDGSGTIVAGGDGGQNPINAPHDFASGDANRVVHAVSWVAPAGSVNCIARFVWDGVSVTAVGCRQIKVERGGLPFTPYSNYQAITVAGTTATWAGIPAGSGKAADNATVGATWSLNLSGQPTALVQINAAEGTKLSGIATGADVTLSAINGGLVVTGGGITLSTGGAIKGGQTAYNTGTGFFLGWNGSAYVLSLGNPAGPNLTWNGSTLTLGGAVNLTVTGSATFDGATSASGSVYAVSANSSGTQTGGVYANGITVGALGNSVHGNGLYGLTFDGTGVRAEATAGTALAVFGPTTTTSNALVSNWNAELLRGFSGASYVLYQNTVDVGNPGTPTHALHCILGSTTFRIPVLIP